MKKYFTDIKIHIYFIFNLVPICIIQGQNENFFEKQVFIFHSVDTLNYRFMRPTNSDTTKKYPLVLFLHGSGERGNDNAKQLKNGALNFASSLNRTKFPCYVVVPQCAFGKQWVDVDWRLPSHIQPKKSSIYLERTIFLLDSLINKLNIDTNRIYITGLSMGGFGVWDAISRWQWKFAAAVPVCGGGDTAKASIVKDIPIWAFHGDIDKVVMVSRSRDMIALIKKAGGSPKYTEYLNTGHNAWTETYSNTEMLEWLFFQSKMNRKK